MKPRAAIPTLLPLVLAGCTWSDPALDLDDAGSRRSGTPVARVAADPAPEGWQPPSTDGASDDASPHALAPRTIPARVPVVDRVVLISVDGLAPRYIELLLDEGALPTFERLGRDGAYTHNARADYAYTFTLPNHTSMLTGRPVAQVEGLPETIHHGYVNNGMPAATATLHNSGNPAVPYVASVLDVVHDFGGKTCVYSGKDKFVIFDQSYDEVAGAPDLVGDDDGRDKIDVFRVAASNTPVLVEEIVAEFQTDPCQLTFLHIAETDPAGHLGGWGTDGWLELLQQVDAWLGVIYDAIVADPAFRNRTALILTADHGGSGYGHSNATDPLIYTIPFYVVAPGVPGGADLYALVPGTRQDPGMSRPSYADLRQPIRNGDAANLVLELLALPSVPGSFMPRMRLVR